MLFSQLPHLVCGASFYLAESSCDAAALPAREFWCSKCRVRCCQHGISLLHWLLLCG